MKNFFKCFFAVDTVGQTFIVMCTKIYILYVVTKLYVFIYFITISDKTSDPYPIK